MSTFETKIQARRKGDWVLCGVRDCGFRLVTTKPPVVATDAPLKRAMRTFSSIGGPLYFTSDWRRQLTELIVETEQEEWEIYIWRVTPHARGAKRKRDAGHPARFRDAGKVPTTTTMDIVGMRGWKRADAMATWARINQGGREPMLIECPACDAVQWYWHEKKALPHATAQDTID
jgi:hypothetical protein